MTSPPTSSRKRRLTDDGSGDEDDDVPLSKRFYQQGRLKSRVRKRKVELIPEVKQEPPRPKEEPSAEDDGKEDLRELLLRKKRKTSCKEEPRPTSPPPDPEMDTKMLEPVMSMHVEDSEKDFDFEEWRRDLIAKKKRKKMNME